MKHIKIYEDFVNESAVNEGRFEMYTPAGDKACQKLVDGIVAKINGDKRVTGEEIEKLLKDGVAKVAKTHREVHDTEPRGEIAHQISKALKAAGYSFYFDSYGHLNEGLNEGNSNDVITMNGDIDFSMQGEADPKKEIAGFEKKFKVKIKATGKSYNTATVEYEITGKKKDIIKFYVDGMEWPQEDLEDSYPELFESELNEGAEPKLEKHNHFIILKGDDVMDNAQTFEKAVEIYNSLKPKSRLIDGREIYQRVWQEK